MLRNDSRPLPVRKGLVTVPPYTRHDGTHVDGYTYRVGDSVIGVTPGHPMFGETGKVVGHTGGQLLVGDRAEAWAHDPKHFRPVRRKPETVLERRKRHRQESLDRATGPLEEDFDLNKPLPPAVPKIAGGEGGRVEAAKKELETMEQQLRGTAVSGERRRALNVRSHKLRREIAEAEGRLRFAFAKAVRDAARRAIR